MLITPAIKEHQLDMNQLRHQVGTNQMALLPGTNQMALLPSLVIRIGNESNGAVAEDGATLQ